MLSFTFNFAAIAGLAIASSSLLMAIVMITLSRSMLNRIWSIFCVAVFIWGISFFFVATSKDPQIALLWWHISHIGVIFIPVFFIHFVYIFLGKRERPWLREIYVAGGLFLAANLFTNYLISGVRPFFDFFYDTPGPLYLPFVIFFHTVIVYGHWLLLRAYLSEKKKLKQREQIRYFFMATFVGFLGGGISFGPVFGLDMYPYTIITVALYPVVMGYAILRFNLFNLRVVAAQLASLAIFVFMFVRFVLSEEQNDLILNGIFLIAAAGLGFFLVRSVTKEVEALEQVRKLAKTLENANARLRELDKQKSEFIGIAAHQLRTPIAAVKGYSSLLLEGSYGKVNEKIKAPLKTIYDSSDRMADTIDDFLNVTRIEQGRMEYHKERMDLYAMIEQVIASFGIAIGEKGLEVSFTTDGCNANAHAVAADPGKIKHVLNNLLDNAIKYTEKGSITVFLGCDKKKRVTRVSVTDTGTGIPKKALGGLFEKFVRTPNGKKVNVNGSGLGLFVARQMVEAHGGRIWAESKGEGKGSTFTFELPLEKLAASGSIKRNE